jgi:hypothetical protein
LPCVQAVIKQRFIYETTGNIKSKKNAAEGVKKQFSEKWARDYQEEIKNSPI